VQRTDTLKVEFSVPERYAGRVRIGSPIAFTVAGSDQAFEGRVYAFDPRIDPATRTLAIRAVCPNADGRLFPGAFANVELTLQRTEDALMIPAVALVPDLGSPYVFVLVAGKAEQRRVVTGMRTDSRLQVLSGLSPGDVVITTGLQQLRSGAIVDATNVGGPALTSGEPSLGIGGDPPGVAASTASGVAIASDAGAAAVAFGAPSAATP
jgi:membrane fusion protein (multidrug efflux system)